MTPFFVRKLAGALAIAMLTAAAPAQLCAQTLPSIPFSERWQELQPNKPKPQAQPGKQPAVGVAQALYLIRSTLLTLNDANRSGNYTVLHDLAAPGFREKNSAADLALIFSNLRRRHFGLFAVALAAPQLTAPPHIENNGMLRLTGYFPTRPLQIKFDLLFQNVGNEWRLFGISVNTPPAPPLVEKHHTKPKNKK
jgi:hypothetical protein